MGRRRRSLEFQQLCQVRRLVMEEKSLTVDNKPGLVNDTMCYPITARPIPPALRAGTGDKLSKEQKAMKIKALEAKLARMEKKGEEEEFKISAAVPSSSSSHGRKKPYSR